MVCDATNTLRKRTARELISEDQTARVVSQEMASGHASGTRRREREREKKRAKIARVHVFKRCWTSTQAHKHTSTSTSTHIQGHCQRHTITARYTVYSGKPHQLVLGKLDSRVQ